MKLKFLGTGTSTGIPQIMCNCAVCRSEDEHDKRLRASAMVTIGETNILIDCGPDFRTQMLRAESPKLEALLITHSHYDHVGGVDDLRPYCTIGDGFPIYCRPDVAEDLRNRVPYCFAEHPYPGVPAFNLYEIETKPFKIGDILVKPIPVMHYKLPIVGYKIGNLAYITDAKTISDSTIEMLQ
ncbi:MAG: MBL fold metallo-hydrolase, partial [Muribaculaceae bacterium]|nr:MBL fold metallo-hydrolase [Muribaculaceae bacterium]